MTDFPTVLEKIVQKLKDGNIFNLAQLINKSEQVRKQLTIELPKYCKQVVDVMVEEYSFEKTVKIFRTTAKNVIEVQDKDFQQAYTKLFEYSSELNFERCLEKNISIQLFYFRDLYVSNKVREQHYLNLNQKDRETRLKRDYTFRELSNIIDQQKEVVAYIDRVLKMVSDKIGSLKTISYSRELI